MNLCEALISLEKENVSGVTRQKWIDCIIKESESLMIPVKISSLEYIRRQEEEWMNLKIQRPSSFSFNYTPSFEDVCSDDWILYDLDELKEKYEKR